MGKWNWTARAYRIRDWLFTITILLIASAPIVYAYWIITN